MTFISLEFLVFVVILLLVYFLVPKKFQWCVLLLFSYVFFWMNSKTMIVFLFLATLISFFTGKMMGSIRKTIEASTQDPKQAKTFIKTKQKRILWIGVCLVLSLLIFLKYSEFLVRMMNLILHTQIQFSIRAYNLFIPLGISYYTLMAISYMIDVYRNKITPETNFFKYMLFLSFFPQILQGPIARYKTLVPQFVEEHQFSLERLKEGIQLILWGLMKKMIIADRIAIPVNQIFNNYEEYQGLIVFFGAALYGIQIYTDFSSGIDIAKGVAQILGITLDDNFHQPYFSESIEEFWRRWHITLGAWMKDYIFYPLSLSKSFASIGKWARKVFGTSIGKKIPSFFAMFIVYFLVGLWHGAEYKYIAYGIWNGLFIMFGILFENSYKQLRLFCGIGENSFFWKLFRRIRTFIIVSLGRYFSRAAGLKVALKMFKNTTIDIKDLSFITNGSFIKLGLDTSDWMIVIIFIALLLFVDYLHEHNISIRKRIAQEPFVFRCIVYTIVLLCLLIFGIYGPEYDAASFIYEQF